MVGVQIVMVYAGKGAVYWLIYVFFLISFFCSVCLGQGGGLEMDS